MQSANRNQSYSKNKAQGALRTRLLAGIFAVATVSGLTLLYQFDPGSSADTAGFRFPPCPFRWATGGLLCPGCGSLRMFHQLLHGDFVAAFKLNPLGLLAAPLLGWFLIDSMTRAIWRRGIPGIRPSPTFIWLTAIVIVVYGIIRNI